MKITSQDTNFSDGNISVTTEHGELLTLIVEGSDGCGNYAVSWDAGDRWMAGQFVDCEDDSQLYPANENSTFDCEDGTELTCDRQQDGGFAWAKSE